MKTDSLAISMLETMTSIQPKFSNDKRKDSIYKVFIKAEAVSIAKKMNDTYMVDIYDKYFTIQEIQKFIDFYKTPEGQKMLNVMPAMQKEIMSTMMHNDLMNEFTEKIKKKIEELNY